MSSSFCGIQTNFLQTAGFQLVLPRFPMAQYFSTDFTLPAIQLPPAQMATPYTNMPLAGDKPVFGEMSFQFIVDEQMLNYEEILKWIKSIGYATGHDAYTQYTNRDKHQPLGEQDAKVILMTNKGNPVRTVTFFDAIPTGLGPLQFSTQDSDTTYIKASVTMAYTHFELV